MNWTIKFSRNHVLSDASKQFNAKLVPEFDGLPIISKILNLLVYEVFDTNGKVLSKVAVTDPKPYVSQK